MPIDLNQVMKAVILKTVLLPWLNLILLHEFKWLLQLGKSPLIEISSVSLGETGNLSVYLFLLDCTTYSLAISGRNT